MGSVSFEIISFNSITFQPVSEKPDLGLCPIKAGTLPAHNIKKDYNTNLDMADIDNTKNVYLFTHGRSDLVEKSTDALVSNGFSKDKIVMADPQKAGDVDEYMAMLWMPPNPDHIKIQKITKVEQAEPTGMIGVWAGVSKEDIFEIKI